MSLCSWRVDAVQECALCTTIPKVNWTDGTEHNLLQTADKRSDLGIEELLIKSLTQEEGVILDIGGSGISFTTPHLSSNLEEIILTLKNLHLAIDGGGICRANAKGFMGQPRIHKSSGTGEFFCFSFINTCTFICCAIHPFKTHLPIIQETNNFTTELVNLSIQYIFFLISKHATKDAFPKATSLSSVEPRESMYVIQHIYCHCAVCNTLIRGGEIKYLSQTLTSYAVDRLQQLSPDFVVGDNVLCSICYRYSMRKTETNPTCNDSLVFKTRFSHKAQSAYNVLLLPRSLDTFQCRTYSAQFPLPEEYSLPGIAACDNGAGKFKLQ